MEQLLSGSRPAQPAATGLTLSVTVAMLVFVVLAWLPLLLALGAAEEPGGWHEEAGIALGLVGLSLLLLQFAHSGRWHLVSGRSGIDVTMRFHRAAAILVLVMVLLHPVLFVLPLLLDDPARGLERLLAMFTSPRMTAGRIAWIALVATVFLALGRRVIPYQYWRLLHGLGALVAAGAGVWHAMDVGLYSSFPPLGALWWAGLIGAALLLAWAWGWKPWRAARAGWRIGAVAPLGPGYWDVTVTGPIPPRFASGQFFWLAFGRAAPWDDNPFSVASAPGARDLRFVIREGGDRTRSISAMPAGLPVRLDGPHGVFTLQRAGPGPLLLIAGGAGIAPILSMIRTLDAADDPRPVTLLHAARTPDRLVCRAEVMAIAERRSWRCRFLAEEAAPEGGAQGRPDHEVLAELLRGVPPAEVSVMICGPEPMTMAVISHLEALGVPPEHIVYELFDYA